MTDSKLLDVDEAAELIGVSLSYAYRVILKLNEELTASGHYVVPGRVNRACLEQKHFDVPGGRSKGEGAV